MSADRRVDRMPAKEAALSSPVLTIGLVGAIVLQSFLEDRYMEPAMVTVAGSFLFLKEEKKGGTTEATASNLWSKYTFYSGTASIPTLQ